MSRSQRSQSGRSAYWQDLVGQWSRSGQTQAAFCRSRGITYSAFTWWKRKLSAAGNVAPHGSRGQRGENSDSTLISGCTAFDNEMIVSTTQAGAFVEVQGSGSARLPAYELILTRGRVLRVYDPFDSNSVVRLIAAVEGVG